MPIEPPTRPAAPAELPPQGDASRTDAPGHVQDRDSCETCDPTSLRAHGRTRATRKAVVLGAALALILALSAVLSVGLGAVTVPPGDVAAILGHHLAGEDAALHAEAQRMDAIIWTIRFPRVVLSIIVGAGLAVAGGMLQTVVTNILADPYVLGVSSGASAGAAAAILFGFGAGLGELALQGSAFLGALAASALVFAVARTAGHLTATRTLLAGIAVGYALQAVTSFLVFASDSAESARSVMFWLLGSLGLASWTPPLAVAAATVALATLLLLALGPSLDALSAGDATALSVGVSPTRLRLVLLVVSCLLVGVLVAAAGAIGFVGLVVPHLARRAVGGRHRLFLPIAALLGGILVCWADVGSRVLLAPQEIPIGIITALAGAPFLLILVRRMSPT